MNIDSSAGSTTHGGQNNFNFLRLLFASLVLLSHAPELVDGSRNRELLTQLFGSVSFGELAVDGFFLVSGYLIVKSWSSQPSAFSFLRKRVLRIYPAFIVASLIGALVVGPLGAIPSEYFSKFWITGFVKGVAFLMPTVTPPAFEGHHYPGVNGAMWTIHFEFICYLLVLVVGFAGGLKKRWVWLLLTACLVNIFLLLKLKYLQLAGLSGAPTIDSLIRLCSFFLVGGCFYLFKDKIRFSPGLGILASLLLVAGMFSYGSAEIFLATFGAYLLFYFAQLPIKRLQWLNGLPDVSYGLYLYGWPVQKLLLWYYPDMSPWTLFPLSLIASAGLGLLSWEVVERPCLRLKSFQWRVGEAAPAQVS